MIWLIVGLLVVVIVMLWDLVSSVSRIYRGMIRAGTLKDETMT